MDHDRSNPGPIGRNRPGDQAEPQYHRAYKACISCRNKKAKCRITAEEYAAGLPCAKCRREMRPCTYTVTRHGPRRQRQSVSQSQDGEEDSIDLGTHSAVQRDDAGDISQDSISADLNNTMKTTVVSNGNDALNLLFEAAQREEREVNGARVPVPIEQHATNAASTPLSSVANLSSNMLPDLSNELTDTWNAYRFVRMGWLSAPEIVWYLDMFFKNVAPLCPILDEFYAEWSNHYLLVTHEPVLTCMILVISSRYHTLPTIGGHSRGYLIHQRLWDHFQHLLMRLVLGLEKYSKAKTRTLGTIEALLLLTDWHPRALTRWREDVIEPANRSDRMCWMVLSCALSLGNELGIFDEQDEHDSANTRLAQCERRVAQHKTWLAKLLYVYQEQLSSRLDRRSMMTPSNSHSAVCSDTSQAGSDIQRRAWTPFLTAWTRLTKIVRSISDLLFPNPTTTSQIIRSGRYISMTEHIQTLLTAWSKDHDDTLSSGTYLSSLLVLEYESTRMHTYSLGLQAILFRTLAESSSAVSGSASFQLTPTDFAHVQEVINSTLNTLKIAIKLYDLGFLRFCTIRTFLHITTASIFLLKGLGLGVSPARLQGALEVLTQVIVALKNSNPDDLHLGGRYSMLLEMHMTRLQEHFVPSTRPQNITPPNFDLSRFPGLAASLEANHFELVDFQQVPEIDTSDENWLSLPLDSNLMSFSMDNFQGLQCLGDGTLDFIWNLGM
ncbi:unnamed protein product [Alternaria burnsii]|nr:unnamed protein product [Alternaria burnsii]